MKAFDVKSSTYFDFNVENSDKDSKFEVGDHVRISKYKNIFAKDYTPNKTKKLLYNERMQQKTLTVKKSWDVL